MKNLALNSDYVVCLSLETTQPASQTNYRRIFTDNKLSELSKAKFSDTATALDLNNLGAFKTEQGDKLPRLVHLDWTICSVKEFKVLEVASIYVNPGAPLDAATQTHTGLTQDVIAKDGVTFTQALEKFTTSVKNNIGSANFSVVTQADWVFKYQLALDALANNVSLPEALKTCTNIMSLHYELLPEKSASELNDLLVFHELEPIQGPTKAKTNSQSIVRLINRMIRHFKLNFEADKNGPATAAAAGSHNSNESTEDSNVAASSVRRRSRSRSSEKMKIDANGGAPAGGPPTFQDTDVVALRCWGCPWQAQKSDLMTFFEKWNVDEDRIEMVEKEEGRFSGIALVLMNSVDEAQEAMNEMQGQKIGHRWIEIRAISYQDYQDKNAFGGRGGGGGGSRGGSQMPQEDVLLSKFLNASNVNRACKLGGLPFRVRPDEIQEFFKDFNVAESDIVIEQQDGRRTGYGLVFLQNEEQVDEAIGSLHRQYIGPRFVNVWQAELRRGGSRGGDDDGY